MTYTTNTTWLITCELGAWMLPKGHKIEVISYGAETAHIQFDYPGIILPSHAIVPIREINLYTE